MMTPSRVPHDRLLGAIARLVAFNPAGFDAIEASPAGFLASLAPLLAFTLVGAGAELVVMGWRVGLDDGLQMLCVLLGQPVISHLYARLWHREAFWLRYATAMNWCQLALPVVGLGLLLLITLANGGIGGVDTFAIVFALLFSYSVLLNWFLAWRGLALGPWRGLAFLFAVTLTLALVLSVPLGLRLAQRPHHPAPALSL